MEKSGECKSTDVYTWKTHIFLDYDNFTFMSAAAELNLEILSHRKLAYFNICFFPQIRTKNIIMKIPEKYESGDILTFLKLKLYLSADSSKQRCFNFFIFKVKLHFPRDTSPQRD